MLPNDYARCQGSMTSYSHGEDGGLPISIIVHPQCVTCARKTDVMPDQAYSWFNAPLGMLADGDALCEWRIGDSIMLKTVED